MNVVFEDNHIIIVSKRSGEIVQGDKTGDRTLADEVKAYIKEKYAKPGNVFLGIAHRLDRPVWGLVVFAKTSKALARLNDMFRNGDVKKHTGRFARTVPKCRKPRLPTGLHATRSKTRVTHTTGKCREQKRRCYIIK